ncbi:MAG: tRNA pseudouridine(38-40) synthase TruA [Woeseia sp.]|nr:tRNA pseudouridine(38-40) synthase TruA [Woeseia sp.]NNL55874.1 tRNA pseudouridine(38-40) synthase TruA [Woeseia sp.]
MRIAMGIEYDGTGYNGWQRQRAGLGVQEVVEKALAVVANEAVEIFCAGRTDSGVHATYQVVHFDTSAERTSRNWILGANSNLPDDINACWVRFPPAEFHARFSAVARTYRYLILNRLVRSSLFRDRAWWVYPSLDVDLMRQAARGLLGEHDFSAFRAAGCQAQNVRRRLSQLDIERHGDWLSITVTANAFLQHMVRNISGLLVKIGSGERDPSWSLEVLESRDRTRGGVAAPAHGLTLTGVAYPAEFDLPAPEQPQLLPGIP